MSGRLGPLLVAAGVLTPEQVERAQAQCERTRRSLPRVLLELDLVTESDLMAMVARHLGLEIVDPTETPVDPGAANLISDGLARRYQVMPIGWEGGRSGPGRRLVVAMVDPTNVVAIDDVRTLTGHAVKVVVAPRPALLAAIDRYLRADGDAEDISVEAANQLDDKDDLSSIREVVEDAPIVRLVNLLLNQAVADRASDIHLEPMEGDVRVRYRIDGVLHEVMRLQKSIQAGVVSRLKIMADVNIAERRVPQDGRLSLTVGGRPIDVRVATLPTVHGEKVVLRLLDKSNALLRLSDLGFLPASLERFSRAYVQPHGTILVTGPTGSGKSTTLYATLNIINDDVKNIITVEDPVEYRLAGVNQMQVNPKAGLTFAVALRSILRADPDVVLVGEIRDKETATIAVEASLTGHLVLSTIHTNDAASTPSRLIEMGVEPFLVASAISCIVAQRLVRRLCDRCKQAYRPDEADLIVAGWDLDDGARPEVLWRAGACGVCGRTGYRGRFALHEVLNVSEEVERLVVDRAHTEEVHKVAVAQGMITLRQAGMRQVAAGLTSIEETLRVVG
ncbi:MAG: GspE/PulE family protein [Acidimicrobiales bacterium]